tara:strand:- start:62 stop:205 length:144 start_codon:yes stop_codon:yes gene_type:complete
MSGRQMDRKNGISTRLWIKCKGKKLNRILWKRRVTELHNGDRIHTGV